MASRVRIGQADPVLKLVLPKGSLEVPTFELFSAADLGVVRHSDVDYRAGIDDPRIDEVRILRPQEIPTYVEEGIFDLGVTGRDWIEETGANVQSLAVLPYSKNTTLAIRVVLAVEDSSKVRSIADLKDGVRVSTEYPGLTARYFAEHNIKADIRFSYGATEAKIPDIADAVVEITETGRALRAAGLRVIETVLESYTELVANKAAYADPTKAHAMHQIRTLLLGALEAKGKVLVKLNVAKADLASVISVLPSMKAPTVSELFDGAGFAVEAVVEKASINVLIPELRDRGASDIIELALAKIVH